MVLENIHKLCKENGVSIARLERDLGIGNGTIGAWDKSSPALANAKAVADYFNVTVDYLLTGENGSKAEKTETEDCKYLLYEAIAIAEAYIGLPEDRRRIIKSLLGIIA